jgi:hypothetical protein
VLLKWGFNAGVYTKWVGFNGVWYWDLDKSAGFGVFIVGWFGWAGRIRT